MPVMQRSICWTLDGHFVADNNWRWQQSSCSRCWQGERQPSGIGVWVSVVGKRCCIALRWLLLLVSFLLQTKMYNLLSGLPPCLILVFVFFHETFTRPWLEFISKSLLMPQSLRAGPWSTAELSSSFKFPFFGFEFPFVKRRKKKNTQIKLQ